MGNEHADAWGLLPDLQCRSVRHLDGFTTAWESWGVHRHSVPSVVVGLAGTSLLDVAAGQILPLGPGDVTLIDPWVWHIHRAPHPGGMSLVMGRIGATADVEVWHSGGVWYGELPQDAVDAAIAGLAAAGAAAIAAAQRLFAALAAHQPQARHVHPALERMSSFAWRMRTQPITAAELLAASGLSYSVAHELFVARFGETPKQYLLRTRLDLARYLLRGGLPLAQVWREAGFASRADLTRRFRLAFDQAPLAWQAAHSGGRAPGASTPRRSSSEPSSR